MSEYRDIFSNDNDRYDQPEQPKKRVINNSADNPLTPDEINSGKVGSAPTPATDNDDFVIGGGFRISDDYASRIRSRKERAMEQGKQRPVSERDVHIGKLSKENAKENKRKRKKKHGPLYSLLWALGIFGGRGGRFGNRPPYRQL